MASTPSQLLQATAEAVVAMQALTAIRYLSAAGLTVLLYDHLFLLGDEIRIVWRADLSWSKILFIYNRYTVPLYLIFAAYTLSGSADLSVSICRNWISVASILLVTSLCIANTFVVQRVYALWGSNKRVLLCSSMVFAIIYALTYVSSAISIVEARPHISYSPALRICTIDDRPLFYILGFSLPILFDIFIFVLTCWNAFDRPRNMQTVLIKQLYVDGVVFFLASTSLRIFNIVVFIAAPIDYLQLGVFFIWAMITALINRMVITITVDVEETYETETFLYGRKVPPPPFDLSKTIAKAADEHANTSPYDFADVAFSSRTPSPDVESDYDYKPFRRIESGTSL